MKAQKMQTQSSHQRHQKLRILLRLKKELRMMQQKIQILQRRVRIQTRQQSSQLMQVRPRELAQKSKQRLKEKEQ